MRRKRAPLWDYERRPRLVASLCQRWVTAHPFAHQHSAAVSGDQQYHAGDAHHAAANCITAAPQPQRFQLLTVNQVALDLLEQEEVNEEFQLF